MQTPDIGGMAPVGDAVADPRLQVMLSVPRHPPVIASVPAVLRTAHDVAALDGIRRLLLCTETPDCLNGWRHRLAALPWTEITSYDGSASISDQLDPEAPVLLLAPNGMPDAPRFRRWLSWSRERRQPTTWVWHGAPVATYYPEAKRLLESLPPGCRQFPQQALSPPDASRVPAPSDSWNDVSDAGGIRRAERRLFLSLRRSSDGYLARLDRTLSIGLSRLLIRTPITPNGITTLTLLLGLLGAVLLARGTSWVSLLGTVVLWSSCVFDGCDGEVARLKILTSPFGARYDALADDGVHLATFVAILLHLHRVRPDLDLAGPAVVLIIGVVLSMVSVWWLINRHPADSRTGFKRLYERLASRDFVYVVVVLTAVERLEWFVWSAAVGANVFWLSLWCAAWRWRTR